MIRLGSTLKATHTTQYHDPQLALQTAATYFLIREIPSSTIPSFSTQTSFLNNPSDDQNSINNGPGLPKSVLEYIFLALVVFLIICIILRRYRMRTYMLRQQQAASRTCRNSPRRPVELRSLHPDGQPYPAYPDPYLREIPAAYMGLPPSRRTRARDIDSSGRRQDKPTEMDHDGDLGANDTLPAYDSIGGPPKYFELDMPSRDGPPLSRITHRPDVSWENINTPVGTTRTHAAQVSQPDTSRPIPPYLENSSSNDSVPMTRPRHEIYRD